MKCKNSKNTLRFKIRSNHCLQYPDNGQLCVVSCKNEETKILLIQIEGKNCGKKKDSSSSVTDLNGNCAQRTEVILLFLDWTMKKEKEKEKEKSDPRTDKPILTIEEDFDLAEKEPDTKSMKRKSEREDKKVPDNDSSIISTPILSKSKLFFRRHQFKKIDKKHDENTGNNYSSNSKSKDIQIGNVMSNYAAVKNALSIDSRDTNENDRNSALPSPVINSNSYHNGTNNDPTMINHGDDSNDDDSNNNRKKKDKKELFKNKDTRSPNEKMKKFFSFRSRKKDSNSKCISELSNQENSQSQSQPQSQSQSLSSKIPEKKTKTLHDENGNLNLSLDCNNIIDKIPLPTYSNRSSVQSNLSDTDYDIDSVEDIGRKNETQTDKKKRNQNNDENNDKNKKLTEQIDKNESINLDCITENYLESKPNRSTDPNNNGTIIPSVALTFLNNINGSSVFQPMTANTPEPIKFENDYFIGTLLLLVNTKPICEQYFKRFEGTLDTLCFWLCPCPCFCPCLCPCSCPCFCSCPCLCLYSCSCPCSCPCLSFRLFVCLFHCASASVCICLSVCLSICVCL